MLCIQHWNAITMFHELRRFNRYNVSARATFLEQTHCVPNHKLGSAQTLRCSEKRRKKPILINFSYFFPSSLAYRPLSGGTSCFRILSAEFRYLLPSLSPFIKKKLYIFWRFFFCYGNRIGCHWTVLTFLRWKTFFSCEVLSALQTDEIPAPKAWKNSWSHTLSEKFVRCEANPRDFGETLLRDA